MTESVLVDTGPLVAMRDADDLAHRACLETAGTIQGPLVTCWPVLTEAAYLLRDESAEVRGLLASAAEPRFMTIASLQREAISPINALIERYAGQHLQLADACLLYLADRIGADTVFTLDRRDFASVPTPSGKFLKIVPETIL